jgi:hypothetical protein
VPEPTIPSADSGTTSCSSRRIEEREFEAGGLRLSSRVAAFPDPLLASLLDALRGKRARLHVGSSLGLVMPTL